MEAENEAKMNCLLFTKCFVLIKQKISTYLFTQGFEKVNVLRVLLVRCGFGQSGKELGHFGTVLLILS